jgi:hypothetical protein
MKAVLSVALILILATSTGSLAAEKPLSPSLAVEKQLSPRDAAGPLARAITREAVRLATTPQASQPSFDSWHNLTAGAEVLLTIRTESSDAILRTYVSAEESRVTFLDLTDPELSPETAQVLRVMARSHPDYLSQARQRTSHYGAMRVGPDGIFLGSQKVATLDRVVQEIERDQIVAVREVVTPKGKGFPAIAKIAIGVGIAFAAISIGLAIAFPNGN